MAETFFNLGFPTTSAPWSYQHSLGISVKDVESWWKNSYPAIKQDISAFQNSGLGPGNAPATNPMMMQQRPVQSTSSDGTTLLVSLLVVGGAIGGYLYWKKQQKAKKA